jgi:hypothetical protein
MKNTLATVALFVLFSFLFSNKTLALLPPLNDVSDKVKINIELPTATPTPIIFKKVDPNINLQLIPTIPLAKLTVTPSPTPGTKLTVTPTPTLGTKLTVTSTEEKTEISPTIETTNSSEMTDNKTDLKTWFMGITMGLLALIIVIQLFPKKKADQ